MTVEVIVKRCHLETEMRQRHRRAAQSREKREKREKERKARDDAREPPILCTRHCSRAEALVWTQRHMDTHQ